MKSKLIFLPIALLGVSAVAFSSNIFESRKANNIEVIDDVTYIQKYVDKDFPEVTKTDKHLILNEYLQNMLDKQPWEKDYVEDNNIIDVVVMLNAEYMPFIKLNNIEETINSSISVIKDEKGKIKYTIDGKSATLKEIEDIYKKIDKNILKNSEYKTQLLQKVLSLLTLNGKNLLLEKSILKDTLMEKVSKGNNIINISLTKSELQNFVSENTNLILKIEQKTKLEAKMASQAQATGVDPQAFNGTNTHGENIDVLFADGGCPYPSWFNNYKYTVLDSSETTNWHTKMVGDIIRYGASEANLLCMDMNTYSNGSFGPSHIDIENHSYGISSGISKEYKTLDAQMDNQIVSSRNTVFIAAGNVNSIVSSPGKALNAITVGNYIENSPYHINEAYVSSWENPNTQNGKPELSAPGTQITDPKQNNLTASGTSFAAPHSAAIAAQLMSKHNWFIHKTMATKAVMLQMQLMKWRRLMIHQTLMI
jgi:hypothetical protein